MSFVVNYNAQQHGIYLRYTVHCIFCNKKTQKMPNDFCLINRLLIHWQGVTKVLFLS